MFRFPSSPLRFHHRFYRSQYQQQQHFDSISLSTNANTKSILNSSTEKWRSFLKNSSEQQHNNNKHAQLAAISVSTNQWKEFLDTCNILDKNNKTVDDLSKQEATKLLISLCFEGHTPWALSIWRRCFLNNSEQTKSNISLSIYPILALSHIYDFCEIFVQGTGDIKVILEHSKNENKSLEAAKSFMDLYQQNFSEIQKKNLSQNERRFAARVGLLLCDRSSVSFWLKEFMFPVDAVADANENEMIVQQIQNLSQRQKISSSSFLSAIWKSFDHEHEQIQDFDFNLLSYFSKTETKNFESLLVQNRHVTSEKLFQILPLLDGNSTIRKYLLHESRFSSSKLDQFFLVKTILRLLTTFDGNLLMKDFSPEEANRLGVAFEKLLKLEETAESSSAQKQLIKEIIDLLTSPFFIESKHTQLLAPSLFKCFFKIRFLIGLKTFSETFLQLCTRALENTLLLVEENYHEHSNSFLETKMISCEKLFLTICGCLSLVSFSENTKSSRIITHHLSGNILKNLLLCFPQSSVFVLPILEDEHAGLTKVAKSFITHDTGTTSLDQLKIVISVLEKRFPIEFSSTNSSSSSSETFLILKFVESFCEAAIEAITTTTNQNFTSSSLLLFLFQTYSRLGIQTLWKNSQQQQKQQLNQNLIQKMIDRLLSSSDSGSKVKLLLHVLPFSSFSTFEFLQDSLKKYVPESDHLAKLCLLSSFHSIGPGSETVKMIISNSKNNNFNVDQSIQLLQDFLSTLLLATENMNNNIDFLVETIASCFVGHLLPLIISKIKSNDSNIITKEQEEKICLLHQKFLNYFIHEEDSSLFEFVKFNQEYFILGPSPKRSMSQETLNVAITIFALEFLWRRVFLINKNDAENPKKEFIDYENSFFLPAPSISKRISALTSKIPGFSDSGEYFSQITKDIDFLLLINSKIINKPFPAENKQQQHRLVKLLHEVFPHNNKKTTNILLENTKFVSSCPNLFKLQNPSYKLILSRMIRDLHQQNNSEDDEDKTFRNFMDKGDWEKALSICAKQLSSSKPNHQQQQKTNVLPPNFWIVNRRAISACFAANTNFMNSWQGALQVIRTLDQQQQENNNFMLYDGLSATTIPGIMIYDRCISLLRQTAKWKEMMLLIDSKEPRRNISLNSLAQLCYARRKTSRPTFSRNNDDENSSSGIKNESLLRLVCWLRSRSFPFDETEVERDSEEIVKFRRNEKENENLLAYRSALAALSVSFVRNKGFQEGAELLLPAMRLTRDVEKQEEQNNIVLKSSRDREFYKNSRTAFREIVRHLGDSEKEGQTGAKNKIWSQHWQTALEFAKHNGREDWCAKIQLELKVGIF